MNWQIYLSYDEDSLAAFANTGLLRRAKKNLDEVQPQASRESLHFVVEAYNVQLPVQGITQASCTCHAQGCCKHILSSILWLQQHPEYLAEDQVSSGQATETPPAATSTPSPDALQSVLKIDSLAVLKQLRKPERQLAFQIWSEWQHDSSLCQADIQHEKINFKTPYSEAAIVYFPQTGISGMLSDVPEKYKLACHVACIATLFQQHTANKWQWPDELQTLFLENTNTKLGTDDLQFIQELKDLCLSFMRQGLSHIAKESALSLHLLNMQARAQNLPRLAGELRRLHGLLQRLLNFDVQVDESRIFNVLATLYAYLSALEQPEHAPKQLEQLRGQLQRNYQQYHIDHLVPLGGEWWTTPSGARGLTLCFWDVQAQALKEVTQARANALDLTFNQDSAAQTGIWGSSVQHLWQHQLRLTKAKVTEQGQLGSTPDTRFQSIARFDQLTPEIFKQHVTGVQTWQALAQQLRPSSSIMFTASRYQLLHVQSCKELELNEVEQQFECWVVDQEERALLLSISIDPTHHAKIDKLQYHIHSGKIIAILVRVELQAQQPQFIPCSLILDDSKGLRIFSLDYDHIPYQKQKHNFLQQFSGRIEKLLERKRHAEQVILPDVINLTLQQTQTLLEFYANTGRQRLDPDDEIRLLQLAHQFDDLGLDIVSTLLKQSRSTQKQFSEKLLQWRHVLLLGQRLTLKLPIQ